MSSAAAPMLKDEEYDGEPIRGLPARLPPGETILWQGAPAFRPLARHVLHLRKLAIYFAILAVWGIASRLSSGSSLSETAVAIGEFAGLAIVAEALLSLFAWLIVRSTVYTITSQRVVIRAGIAMPVTVQIPFSQIAGAGLRQFADGTGDVALSLLDGQRIAYLLLWPHARPWRYSRAEPSFRSVPDAVSVAALLGRALAASTAQPAVAVASAQSTDQARLVPVPAAA